jgi:NAD+ synthase (glutamine-hydrolysing)
MKLKIALGQMRVKAGHIQENVKTMQTMIHDAKQQGADMIVFPEMCISGYMIADRYHDFAFLSYAEKMNEVIKELSSDIIVVWGNIALSIQGQTIKGHDGRFGRANSVYMAYNKQYVARENGLHYPGVKTLLPNYRVFDDARYFLSSIDLNQRLGLDFFSPFVLTYKEKQYRFGLEVCEDLWSQDYEVNPTLNWVSQNVDLIINVSASPWTLNKESSRFKALSYHVKQVESFPPFVYVNQVGFQNNGKNVIGFDGGSMIVDHLGQVMVQANDDFQQALVFETQPQNKTMSKLLQGLVESIKCFDEEILPFKPKWIVGLSGGLDSSIGVSLLTMALGKERVIGVNMATQYNSQATISNAQTIADKLGITYSEGSIEPLVKVTHQVSEAFGFPLHTSLAQENAQARLRGHLLSSIASSVGGVILNNSNKVETALGYATLYGDTIGALAPLGDCTKVQLFDLANEINALFQDEIIPYNLIGQLSDQGYHFDLPPSAELKEKQVDPMKWGYHDALVSKLTLYPGFKLAEFEKQVLSNSLNDETMAFWLKVYGLDQDHEAFKKDLTWFKKSVSQAIFKRIQMPPIVLISRGAFGFDYREVQGTFEEETL